MLMTGARSWSIAQLQLSFNTPGRGHKDDLRIAGNRTRHLNIEVRFADVAGAQAWITLGARDDELKIRGVARGGDHANLASRRTRSTRSGGTQDGRESEITAVVVDIGEIDVSLPNNDQLLVCSVNWGGELVQRVDVVDGSKIAGGK